MVVVHQNKDGFVDAYVDYQIVNELGKNDKDGIYCWVNEAWVHPTIRFKGFLKYFVRKRYKFHPQVKWIYWTRRKYGERMSMYDITKLLH